MSERTYTVDLLTRVEGEGRFHVVVDEAGAVSRAELSIFEAPRYFEALLRGRSLYEVPDIVARICGICPVAYQMSSVRALEQALGLAVSPDIRRLRRLMYCGEWIESHALHVFLLHAPDFLGYPSGIEMARDHRALVERGLGMKKAGNRLIEILGGRAIHPVSPRVGGFTRAVSAAELAEIRGPLASALDDAEATVDWASDLEMPPSTGEYVFVALDGDAYPLETGDHIAVTGRGRYPVEEFEDVFHEQQVAHSHALQCRLRDGTAYLCGPLARINHFADRLHPRARDALTRSALPWPIVNPHQSIVVRAIELVHALAEAIDIIDSYRQPRPAFIDGPARDAVGHGATEAPRGLLYHRYRTNGDGLIAQATIVPPTSQNQARIEQDLIDTVPQLLAMQHDQATRLCERVIRAYDPCISCATHFLTLDMEKLP